MSLKIRSALLGMLVLLLALATLATAQTPVLVKDINDASDSNEPISPVVAGNNLFYLRDLPDTGPELWVTDITSGVSSLVKDISPGPNSSNIASLTAFGNKVVFGANDGVHGVELWTSDGTPGGTKMVLDINPLGNSYPGGFSVYFNNAVFSADDGVHGQELWITDLTPGGTKLLADINPGSAPSYPQNIVTAATDNFNNKINGYFMSAQTASLGTELVKIPFGFQQGVDSPVIIDINAGAGSSYPTKLIVNQASLPVVRILFSVQSGGAGTSEQLWITGGDAASTKQVSSFLPGVGTVGLYSFTNLFGKLFFGASTSLGYEPCVSDGTAANTKCFDVVAGSGSSNPSGFLAVNGYVYFSAETPGSGRELWRTNGAQPTQVADIAPGSLGSIGGINASGLGRFNNSVFVGADDRVNGTELWSSDGTTTTLLKDIFPGSAASDPKFLANSATGVIITARSGSKRYIWKSDGTANGTTPLFDLSMPTTPSSSPSDFFNVGKTLLFSASTFDYGLALWTSDGSAGGTHLVKKLESTPHSGFLEGTVSLGSTGIFGFSGQDGNSLWHSDGTDAGTNILAESVGIVSLGHRSYATLNGITYFPGNTSATGAELWRSNGAAAGTYLVADLALGNSNSYPTDFTVINNKLLFVATVANDSLLYLSDGTNLGTNILKNTNNGGKLGTNECMELNGSAVFNANFTNLGNELGITDGTSNGTILLSDINSGSGGSSPRGFVRVGSSVYFTANPNAASPSLYKTDGTPGGTVQVLLGGITGFTPDTFTASSLNNTLLIFIGSDSAHGKEVWVSDGTGPGTKMLKDINPGTSDSSIYQFSEIDGFVYFAAEEPEHSRELWRTDGTPAGTVLVADMIPGTIGSYPHNFFPFRGSIYFAAGSPNIGAELWKVVHDECPDDPSKKLAGQCGCGVPETPDTDLDGTPNCNDSCPNDPAKTSPGVCGCGLQDSDSNSNGIADCLGNQDLNAQIAQVELVLKKIKKSGNKKARAALKLNVASMKKLLTGIANFSAANASFIHVNSAKPITALVSSVNKLVRKALNVNSSAFSLNKKKASKAISALKKSLA